MTRSVFKRPFRILGFAFIGTAAALVLLGAWTFTFSKTEGELTSIENAGRMMSGGYSGIPFVNSGPTHTSSVAVSYRYRVDENRLKGTRIGMGLAPWTLSPLGPMRWERHARPGATLTVYHAPGRPSISVLHRGFDVVSVAVLALVGIALLKFSAWLARHQHPRGQPVG